MNIYVGNLSYTTTDEELRQAFGAHGEVTSVNIIKDRFSGESRGFGFVEMATNEEAQAAIANLNGTELGGTYAERQRGSSAHRRWWRRRPWW